MSPDDDEQVPVESILSGYDREICRLTRRVVTLEALLEQRNLERARTVHQAQGG